MELAIIRITYLHYEKKTKKGGEMDNQLENEKRSSYEQKADEEWYIAINKHICTNESSKQIYGIWHYHHAVEIKIVQEGQLRAYCDGYNKKLNAGDMAFIDSGKPHAYRLSGKSVHYSILFPRRFLKDLEFGEQSFPLFLERNQAFDEIVRSLEDAYKNWKEQPLHYKRGFIYRILGILLQNFQPETFKSSKNTFELQVIEYIEKRYRESLTLKTISTDFGYTETYFSKLFNEAFSMTLREYINRKRLSKAKDLKKKEPSLSWAKVAYAVGYTDPKIFYRIKKKYEL